MRQFDQSLKEVKRVLLTMGEKLEIAVDKAVRSLAMQNDILAKQVVLDDKEMDRLETVIDDTVAKLIATQQPVAKDLRLLIAAIKIASDMERMADLAVNIAQVTIEMKESNLVLFKELIDIPKMAQITQKMVNDGINSYIDGNTDLAKQLAKTDNQVDQMYYDLLKELSFYMQEKQHVEVAIKLCFVARYLERIADHATNIAESVVYIETGKQVDLN
ncbi:phosphate transport system regulatory protein PhoU [Laceyella sacchari]|uniref:Phosphate-specific transport system accessory protein PhoU n=1 Tax=Laceyella tengchongensis TaxID=574699 RepID=A0AA45WJR1_9BACL|nr:phosphate signaling complex protein PhoU [Laceyella tengchongensis]AUS08241.1 phosphate transport system regulatory protein PhoU [Laceyella sacchari]MRG26900.1 phosphate signaling complex protein PhoU [Laceyella tengchongensis]SMP04220.1 phosphate uptake regulator, PhoU [Laceyella tengchongensis]